MAELAAEASRRTMQEGRNFTQYVLQGSEVQKKSIFLFYEPASSPSTSLGALYWCTQETREMIAENCLYLNFLSGILISKQSEVFRNAGANEAVAEHCFSVVANDRVLDLEAGSRELLETWTLGIEALMAPHCVTKVKNAEMSDPVVLPRLSTPSRPLSSDSLPHLSTPSMSTSIASNESCTLFTSSQVKFPTPIRLPTPSQPSLLSPTQPPQVGPPFQLAQQLPSQQSTGSPLEEDQFSGSFELKPSAFPLATPMKEAPSPLNTRLRGRFRPSITHESLMLGEFRSADEVFGKHMADTTAPVPQIRESMTRLSMVNYLSLKERRVQELQSKIDRLAGSLNSPAPKQMCTSARQAPRVGGLNLTKPDLKELIRELRRETEIDLEAFKGDMERTVLGLANAFNLERKNKTLLEETLRLETRRRKVAVEKVLDLQGSIRVFCRVRPLMPKELSEGDNAIIKVDQEDSLVMAGDGDTKRFTYDHIFGPQSTQEQVFSEVSPLVDSCISGYTVCIFAYGQTGSGKTHTMEGSKNDRGVNYRALQYLFETCSEEKKQNPHLSHQVNVSVVEIYMEEVRDLLSRQGPGVRMEIREGAEGVYIPGLEERVVTSVEEVQELMRDEAYPNRKVRGTSMNDRSSRSHCLVFVRCLVTNALTGVKTLGTLILIDLAGSERLKKSEAVGEAMKEAQAINKSLAALGNVIAALQQKTAHVPFRDSKLTFLLQNSLGGCCKCLMFCQIGPAASNYQETSCSLTFANRVRATKLGQAKKNFAAEAKATAEPRTPVNPKMKDQMKSMEQSLKTTTELLNMEKIRSREQELRIRELEQRLHEQGSGGNTGSENHESDREVDKEFARQPEKKAKPERVLQPTRTNEVRREAFISSIHSETTRLDTKKKLVAVSKPRAVRETRSSALKDSESPEKGVSPGRKRKGEETDKSDKENEVNRPSQKTASRSKSLSHVHKKPKQRAKKTGGGTLGSGVSGTMGRSRRFAF